MLFRSWFGGLGCLGCWGWKGDFVEFWRDSRCLLVPLHFVSYLSFAEFPGFPRPCTSARESFRLFSGAVPDMSKRLLKRLSSNFKRRSVRTFRKPSEAGLVQVLEVRQMLTAPTLDTLYDITLAEDAPERSVDLTGITAGAGETQPLRVTAVSGNTLLIASPSVDYTTPNTTGTLRFRPVAEKYGATTITVTVEDGGPDLNLATPGDNESFSRTFNVNVTPVNDVPTLNQIGRAHV